MGAFRLVFPWLVAACGARTELMIGVATDLKAPDALDRVQLDVVRNDSGVLLQSLTWDLSGSVNEPFNLPGSYGVFSDGDEIAIDLRLTGFKGETELVERRAIVSLVEGETLFYRLGITAGCVGRNDCPEGTSCVEGVCRDDQVDSAQLPPFDDLITTELSCSATAVYIDTATGDPMPQSPDAAACPAGLCVEGTCLRPPVADDGTRTVRGSQVFTFVEPGNATTNVPIDQSTVPWVALVPDGAGGFTTFTGTGSADGTFSIPGVPKGPVYLRGGNNQNYLLTSSNLVDFGGVVLGRPDQTTATNTTINVNATNLSPWAQGDLLEAYAPTANAFWFFLETFAGMPPDGATALTNYSFTANLAGVPGLIQNDPFALIQYETRSTNGIAYRAATKMFVPSPFTQTNGGTTQLTGAFQDLPQTKSLSLDVRELEWENTIGFDGTHATLMNPTAVPFRDGVELTFSGLPHAESYGSYAASVDYFVATVPLGVNSTLPNVTYGEPHVSAYTFTPIISASLFTTVDYFLPNTTTPATTFMATSINRVITGTSATLLPDVGPVLSPQINGTDLFQPQQGVGPSPTISWSPPASGSASGYFINVFRLSKTLATTNQSFVGSVITSETSVQLPPGMLEAGNSYFIQVKSTNLGNIDAPNRGRFPDSVSFISSAIVSP